MFSKALCDCDYNCQFILYNFSHQHRTFSWERGNRNDETLVVLPISTKVSLAAYLFSEPQISEDKKYTCTGISCKHYECYWHGGPLWSALKSRKSGRILTVIAVFLNFGSSSCSPNEYVCASQYNFISLLLQLTVLVLTSGMSEKVL